MACVLLLPLLVKVAAVDDPALAPGSVAPIKIEPNGRLRADVLAHHKAWYARAIIAPFKARSKGAKWETEALLFAQDSADACYFIPAKVHGRFAPLYEKGRNAIQAGCDDPLIVYLFERLQFQLDEDQPRAKAAFRSLFDKAQHRDDLGSGLLSLLGKELVVILGKAEYDEQVAQKACEWIRAAFKDGTFGPDDGELFLQYQFDPNWLGVSPRMPDLLSALYKVAPFPDWVMHNLRGQIESRLGWSSRGGDLAYKVTPAGWTGFAEHMDKAREEFVEAWKLRPDQPEAAAQMIDVTMAAGGKDGETVRIWFDRAVAAQFDYWPAYTRLLWAYRPRWGGSIGQMFAFGKVCADTKRYETDVPHGLYEATGDIIHELPDWRPFFRQPEVAKPIIELSKALAVEPTREFERSARESLVAIYAWICGDFSLAEKTLASLTKLDPNALARFPELDLNERMLRQNVALMASPARGNYEQAESAYQRGDLKAAREACKQAAELTDTPFVRALIASRLAVIDVEESLSTGKWVKLTPAPELLEWTVQNGDWTANAEGALINHGENATAFIYHQARVGPEFEMRADFELSEKPDFDRECGIGFGFHKKTEKLWTICQVEKHGDAENARLLDRSYSSGVESHPVKLRPKSQIFVRGSGGKITFECNGERVFDNIAPGSGSTGPQDGRVGIGAYYFLRGNTTLITNIEVRKLNLP